MQVIRQINGFDWKGRDLENDFTINGIHWIECEEVFFNEPLISDMENPELKHGENYYALGVTDSGLHLFVAFEIIEDKIRIIAARAMSDKEKKLYEKE
ncbi:BrnT family toxin [bacterium]|nr:BrnT family toxin [bacterium]